MRTIKELAIPQNTDLAKFPDGALKNETDTESGTPVIESVYGDIIANVYKILSLTKTAPTETQDNEISQHQIVDALRKWTNELNDQEQVLTLAGTVWSLPFDLDILPDKYVVVARASDPFDTQITYTFKGTGVTPVFSITSLGFSASDEVLIIIDSAEVRIISLTRIAAAEEQIYTGFATPLPFNETNTLRYNENGKIITNLPSVTDLQVQIRALSADALAEVFDMVILKSFVLCFTYLPGATPPSTATYKFFHFSLSDLNTAVEVPVTGIVPPASTDNQPYMYTDGTLIYITNLGGTNATDEDLAIYSYTPATPTITNTTTLSLDPGFIKTSNVVITATDLFTFIGSQLKKYSLSTGAEIIVDEFSSVIGLIFQFNGNVFYTNREIAIKWTI